MIPTDKFTNANGRWVTSGLFDETATMPREYVIFSFKPQRLITNGLISFSDLYREHWEDTTEYTFAMEVFGYWDFWRNCRETPKLLPYLHKLREERDVALKSKAFKSILKEATDGKSPFNAAKYLIEQKWDNTPAGRRRKEKTNSVAHTNAITTEDEKRLKEFLQ